MSKKRRQFTPEFKLECVLDIISGRKRPVEICNQYQISGTLTVQMAPTLHGQRCESLCG